MIYENVKAIADKKGISIYELEKKAEVFDEKIKTVDKRIDDLEKEGGAK